jgi:DNA uptake protein ComE-like DNA-binding protein
MLNSSEKAAPARSLSSSLAFCAAVALIAVFAMGAGALSSRAHFLQAAGATGAENWDVLLPEGSGKAVLTQRCSVCHGLDMIVFARGDRTFWQDTLTRMIGNGAELTNEEIPPLAEYLASSFGQDRPKLVLPVDINSADAPTLSMLPPLATCAQAIVDARTKNGGFQQVDDLLKVENVTPAILDQVRPFLTVRPGSAAPPAGSAAPPAA